MNNFFVNHYVKISKTKVKIKAKAKVKDIKQEVINQDKKDKIQISLKLCYAVISKPLKDVCMVTNVNLPME